jgi:SAM-dependent methyltransferase
VSNHKNSAQSPDLGYSWKWTYGHLIPASMFAAAAATVALLGVPWWVWLPLSAIALWLFSGFIVMRFGVRMNQIPALPAKAFLAKGGGRVLDVGCGSGRTSISVARSRPAAIVVGLDNFSHEYMRNAGAPNTEKNFRLAGIAERATVQTGDMRDMPFEDSSFDAVASSAAIDHLKLPEIRQTLAQVHRVLVPGGQFLLMVVVPNVWLTIAFGPLMHGKLQGRRFWRDALGEAGFVLEDEGTVRTTAWFLTKRSSA